MRHPWSAKGRPARAGIGITEALVAAAILGTLLVGFGTVMDQYLQSRRKISAVLLASGLEVDLVLQISNPLSGAYTVPAIAAAILAGGDISAITFPLATETGSFPATADGVTRFLRADGTACADFDDPRCAVSMVLNVQTVGSRHRFSYEINVNTQLATVARFGDAANFTSYVPTDLYKPVAIQQCDVAVPPAAPPGDIGVRGINRTTGQVYCISKPPAPCPPDTLPTGTTFVDDFLQTGSSGGRLEMNCAPVVKPNVTCGGDYVLNAFNATAAGATGDCVHKLASPATWPKTYESELSVEIKRACPKDYRVVPNCTVTATTAGTNAVCPGGSNDWPGETCTLFDPCLANPPACAPPAPLPYPTPTCDHDPGVPTYYPPVTIPFVDPTVGVTINATQDGFKCEVQFPAQPGFYDRFQPGGGTANTWCTTRALAPTPRLRAGFSCVLTVPDTAPAN